MKKLSVNVDHVATLREARKTIEPGNYGRYGTGGKGHAAPVWAVSQRCRGARETRR